MVDTGELEMQKDDGVGAQRCPSAQPGMEEARILGIVEGTAGQPAVTYVDEAIPVTQELLDATGGVEPTEILRISAKCDEKMCMHFDGARCQLASRVIESMPIVVDALPACTIRPTCRWYLQEGPPACQRCPQVATINTDSNNDLMAAIAYGPEILALQTAE